MSITLTSQMFSKLSADIQKEILSCFCEMNSIDETPTVVASTLYNLPPWKPAFNSTTLDSPFSSAALSFSQPLTLPPMEDLFELKKKTVRHAVKVPAALSSDIYSINSKEEIDDIVSDIDLGYFVGPSSWERGKKHHPENFDVRRVLQILRTFGPQNSYFINMKLMTVDRTRISAILRQLRIQGIITAKAQAKSAS